MFRAKPSRCSSQPPFPAAAAPDRLELVHRGHVVAAVVAGAVAVAGLAVRLAARGNIADLEKQTLAKLVKA